MVKETISNTIDFVKLQEQADSQAKTVVGACPQCGYCPHCGRGGWQTYPMYPQYPYYPGITRIGNSTVQDPNTYILV